MKDYHRSIKFFVASDHAGVDLKKKLIQSLSQFQLELGNTHDDQCWLDIEWHDLGPDNTQSVDYPDYADLLCQKISPTPSAGQTFLSCAGILICGSGQGMAIRANKYAHIRAALAWNTEIAKLSREHNDANVLCIGARFIGTELAIDMVKVFLKTEFEGGRHQKRVDKISSKII